MWRIVESISGSYAGRIAPPGMPKMFSVPAASSDLIRLCAPVICSLIWSCPVIDRGLPQQKTPRPPGQRGEDALADQSAGTPSAYEKVLSHAHTVSRGFVASQ